MDLGPAFLTATIRDLKLSDQMDVAQLRVRFSWLMENPSDREQVLEALKEIGLPVEVLPDELPPPPDAIGLGGGQLTLPVDLILQHGFNIADGVATAAILLGLSKAFNKIKHLFGAAKVSVEKREHPAAESDLSVSYFIYFSAECFEERALVAIAEDFCRMVDDTRTLRAPRGPGDLFHTARIQIERYSDAPPVPPPPIP